MITKTRLKELVNQGATIYGNGFGEIELIPDNDISIYENGNNGYVLYVLEPNKKYKNEIFDEDLFESKEDMEEYLEFANIERIEKFPYVSYEDFCKGKRMRFDGKNGFSYCCELGYINQRFVVIYKPLLDGCIFREPLTRENYHKALDICVKLWKGEE